MKAYLEPWVYGEPPVTRIKKKVLKCGHSRDRAVISRDLGTAWCWRCQKRVPMVRIPRVWRMLTRRRS